jgi:hypothetical protein
LRSQGCDAARTAMYWQLSRGHALSLALTTTKGHPREVARRSLRA